MKGCQMPWGNRYYNKEYRDARTAVLKRDGYKCRNCGFKNRQHLQIHHIKKWADYPTLRYAISNMITLCKPCHRKLWAKEEDWESHCLFLLNKDAGLDIRYELWKQKQEDQ